MTSPIDECIQLQRGYNAIMNLWADTLIGDDMTPNVKDYTTEELERLTTLNGSKAKKGEYLIDGDIIALRVNDAFMVFSDGSTCSLYTYDASAATPAERRVKGFVYGDESPTELDPPQEAMLAELKRRKEPPISNATHAGRRVRVDGYEAIVVSNVAAFAWREYCSRRGTDHSAVICWLCNGYLAETGDHDKVELL